MVRLYENIQDSYIRYLPNVQIEDSGKENCLPDINVDIKVSNF